MKIKKLIKNLKAYKRIGYKKLDITINNKDFLETNFVFYPEKNSLDISTIEEQALDDISYRNYYDINELLYGYISKLNISDMKVIGTIYRVILNLTLYKNSFVPIADEYIHYPVTKKEYTDAINLIEKFDSNTQKRIYDYLSYISPKWKSVILHIDVLNSKYININDDEFAKIIDDIINKKFMC